MSQQINLINPAFLRKKTHFTLMTMCQGLVMVLAGALLLYAYGVYQVSELDKQTGQSTRRLNAEQASLAAYSAGYSPQMAKQLLENELVQLEKKAAEAAMLTETLSSGEGSNTSGYSEYMRAFSRQVLPGLWLTNFKLNTSGISLEGGALAPELVPGYIQRLGRESVMKGKNFSNLQIKPAKEAKYLEFTLYSSPEEEAKP